MKPISIADHKANELISRTLDQLMADYPFEGGRISGKGIVEFSKHKQINNFILFQIYQDWSNQVNNFIHPYFDFGSDEVKQALRHFQNVLSRHIQVEKGDFRSLLEKAIYNTLRLILDPVEALRKFYFKGAGKVRVDLFRKHAVYFTDFDFAIQSILKFYEKNGIEVIEEDDFFQKFARIIGIFESREGKSIEAYQRHLFQLAFGQKLEDLEPCKQGEAPAEPAPTTPPPAREESRTPPPTREEPRTPPQPEAQTPPPAQETPATSPEVSESIHSKFSGSSSPSIEVPPQKETFHSRFSENREEKTVADSISSKPADTPAPSPEPREEVREEPSSQPQPEPEMDSTAEESSAAAIDLFSTGSDEESSTGSMFGGDKQPTLADRLGSGGGSSLHESIAGNSSNKKLSESIPVHKQFQFVQKLFAGSSVKFKVVLEKVEESNSMGEAREIMSKYVFNHPDIRRDTKLAQEFVDLVEGRFES